VDYHERLTAPAWYWLVAIVFGVSSVVAVGFWYGPWVAAAGALVVTAATTVLLAWAGRTDVAVTEKGLRVGPSVLEWPYVGRVEALDAEATRELLGVKADARAFTVEKAWLTESVVVTVDDAADPHPYWVIGSRRPAQLADAIERRRAEVRA
jgi:hypothetical protein